jgi:hypothetical protein
MVQPPSWLNDLRFDGRFYLEWASSRPSSRELPLMAFGVKAHSLLFNPPFIRFLILFHVELIVTFPSSFQPNILQE